MTESILEKKAIKNRFLSGEFHLKKWDRFFCEARCMADFEIADNLHTETRLKDMSGLLQTWNKKTNWSLAGFNFAIPSKVTSREKLCQRFVKSVKLKCFESIFYDKSNSFSHTVCENIV